MIPCVNNTWLTTPTGKPVSFTPQFITIATTEAQPGLRTFEVFSCTPGHEKAVMKKRL